MSSLNGNFWKLRLQDMPRSKEPDWHLRKNDQVGAPVNCRVVAGRADGGEINAAHFDKSTAALEAPPSNQNPGASVSTQHQSSCFFISDRSTGL